MMSFVAYSLRVKKYNAYIILLHERIGFKAKCERREMSSTNFKLCLLKVTFLIYMFKHIEISILEVINFTSSDVFELNFILEHAIIPWFCVPVCSN